MELKVFICFFCEERFRNKECLKHHQDSCWLRLRGLRNLFGLSPRQSELQQSSLRRKRSFLRSLGVAPTKPADVLLGKKQVVCDAIVIEESSDDDDHQVLLASSPKRLIPADGRFIRQRSSSVCFSMPPEARNVAIAKHDSAGIASRNAGKLLRIDVCSPLGKRLKAHMDIFRRASKRDPCQPGCKEQPLSDKKRSTSRPSLGDSGTLNDRLRSAADYRVTFRPGRLHIRRAFCHLYKFSRTERLEFCAAFDSGLSVRARRLLGKTTPCRVLLERVRPSSGVHSMTSLGCEHRIRDSVVSLTKCDTARRRTTPVTLHCLRPTICLQDHRTTSQAATNLSTSQPQPDAWASVDDSVQELGQSLRCVYDAGSVEGTWPVMLRPNGASVSRNVTIVPVSDISNSLAERDSSPVSEASSRAVMSSSCAEPVAAVPELRAPSTGLGSLTEDLLSVASTASEPPASLVSNTSLIVIPSSCLPQPGARATVDDDVQELRQPLRNVYNEGSVDGTCPVEWRANGATGSGNATIVPVSDTSSASRSLVERDSSAQLPVSATADCPTVTSMRNSTHSEQTGRQSELVTTATRRELTADMPALVFMCSICGEIVRCEQDAKTLICGHYATHGVTNIELLQETTASGQQITKLIELPAPKSDSLTACALELASAVESTNCQSPVVDVPCTTSRVEKKRRTVTWADQQWSDTTPQRHNSLRSDVLPRRLQIHQQPPGSDASSRTVMSSSCAEPVAAVSALRSPSTDLVSLFGAVLSVASTASHPAASLMSNTLPAVVRPTPGAACVVTDDRDAAPLAAAAANQFLLRALSSVSSGIRRRVLRVELPGATCCSVLSAGHLSEPNVICID